MNDEREWILTGGSASAAGSGSDLWTYSGSGTYWRTLSLGTISGTMQHSGQAETTTEYANTSTFTPYSSGSSSESGSGTWSYSGDANMAEHGEDHFSYSGSGSYLRSINGSTVNGTMSESGKLDSEYLYSKDFEMESDGDLVATSGIGNEATRGDRAWQAAGNGSYTLTDGQTYSITGTYSESATDLFFFDTATTSTLGAYNNWITNGNRDESGSGSDSQSYSGSGSFGSSSGNTTYSSHLSHAGNFGYTYQFATTTALTNNVWHPAVGSGAISGSGGNEHEFSATSTASGSSTWSSGSASGFSWYNSKLEEGEAAERAWSYSEKYSILGDEWTLESGSVSGNGSLHRDLSYSASGSSGYDYEDATYSAGNGEKHTSNGDYRESVDQVADSHVTWTANIQRSSGGGSGSGYVVTYNVQGLISASGVAISENNYSWSDSARYTGGGYTSGSDSGGSSDMASYDDYDHLESWSEVKYADGSTSSSGSATNDVTGAMTSEGTWWWSWFESYSGGGSGFGSGGGWSTSSADSGGWSGSTSYSGTVNYPGFYQNAYYDGPHSEYIGPVSPSGGYMMAMVGSAVLPEIDTQATSGAMDEVEKSESDGHGTSENDRDVDPARDAARLSGHGKREPREMIRKPDAEDVLARGEAVVKFHESLQEQKPVLNRTSVNLNSPIVTDSESEALSSGEPIMMADQTPMGPQPSFPSDSVGRWGIPRFFRDSGLDYNDYRWGCGGLAGARAGLGPDTNITNILRKEGVMAFGTLADAVAYLKNELDGKGLIVGNQMGTAITSSTPPYPEIVIPPEGVPGHAVLHTALNFATLLGTPDD